VRRRCGACRGESASVTIAQSRSAHSSTRSHETVRGTSAARGPVRGSGADRASFLSSIRDRERLRALSSQAELGCWTLDWAKISFYSVSWNFRYVMVYVAHLLGPPLGLVS